MQDGVDVRNEAGARRLDDPADFVRLETASALRRDIPVIPVVVRGAKMPAVSALPDDLKDLSYRNAVELTLARWSSDVQLLIKALRPFVDSSKQATVKPEKPPVTDRQIGENTGGKKKRNLIPTLAIAVIVIIGTIAAYFALSGRKVTIPTVPDAATKLGAGHLAVGTTRTQTRAGATAGTVVSQSPGAGRQVKENSLVDLVISDQPQPGRISKTGPTNEPNFAGIWSEVNPKDPGRPMQLRIVRNGAQIAGFISYTGTFSNKPLIEAEITQGRATTSRPQSCAPQFQKPGYNYDEPGVNIFTLSLRGSTLMYEQDTKWSSPCDGHPIGVEQTVRELQRVSP